MKISVLTSKNYQSMLYIEWKKRERPRKKKRQMR